MLARFRREIVLLKRVGRKVSVCLEGEVVRHFVLIGEIEETDRPLTAAVETIDYVSLDLID